MGETSLRYAKVQNKSLRRPRGVLGLSVLDYCCSSVISGVSLVYS